MITTVIRISHAVMVASTSTHTELFAFPDTERVAKVLFHRICYHLLLLIVLPMNSVWKSGSPLKLLCFEKLDNDRAIFASVLHLKVLLCLAHIRWQSSLIQLVSVSLWLSLINQIWHTE